MHLSPTGSERRSERRRKTRRRHCSIKRNWSTKRGRWRPSLPGGWRRWGKDDGRREAGPDLRRGGSSHRRLKAAAEVSSRTIGPPKVGHLDGGSLQASTRHQRQVWTAGMVQFIGLFVGTILSPSMPRCRSARSSSLRGVALCKNQLQAFRYTGLPPDKNVPRLPCHRNGAARSTVVSSRRAGDTRPTDGTGRLMLQAGAPSGH